MSPSAPPGPSALEAAFQEVPAAAAIAEQPAEDHSFAAADLRNDSSPAAPVPDNPFVAFGATSSSPPPSAPSAPAAFAPATPDSAPFSAGSIAPGPGADPFADIAATPTAAPAAADPFGAMSSDPYELADDPYGEPATGAPAATPAASASVPSNPFGALFGTAASPTAPSGPANGNGQPAALGVPVEEVLPELKMIARNRLQRSAARVEAMLDEAAEQRQPLEVVLAEIRGLVIRGVMQSTLDAVVDEMMAAAIERSH